MRTAAQELRRPPRFERNIRERAAPLVILLEILALINFVREGRRGDVTLHLNFVSQDKIELRTRCNEHFENHDREIICIGQQDMGASEYVSVPPG